jgi:drug/metabolite transporter (DMT)-like permease
MPIRDMVLAALTSVVWGLAFVATKLALDSFSAAQLTALRFLIACLPVLFVKRPPIGWPSLALIGLTLFTGQFLLLFFAFAPRATSRVGPGGDQFNSATLSSLPVSTARAPISAPDGRLAPGSRIQATISVRTVALCRSRSSR